MILPPDLGYELVNPPLNIGEGFQFGRGTKVNVAHASFGSPEVETQDQPNSRDDGLAFGKDFMRGRLISFDINIRTYPGDSPSAHTLYSGMEAAWFTEDTHFSASRLDTGSVSQLVMNRHGETKVAYGRPRRIEPTTGRVDSGWIPVTCDFQMLTHKFYSAILANNDIGIVPGGVGGGFQFPLEFPASDVAVTEGADVVYVGGNTDTWMMTYIHGPITAPIVDVVGYYQIKTSPNFTLGVYDYLEIDPRPWSRKILMNGTVNVAGRFTQDSRRISMQTLPPGTHQIVLRGTDPTGTAYLSVSFNDAWTTW
jgi:hypothetical protein